MDEQLKIALNRLGFNIDAMNRAKIAIDEFSRHKTGRVYTGHCSIPDYVMKADTWGITQSTIIKNIILLDYDGKKIPEPLKKIMLTYRVKKDRESFHGILRITNVNKDDCDNLAKRFSEHGGLEIFAGGKRLAFRGTYDVKDGKSSAWNFCDIVTQKNLESKIIPEMNIEEFHALMSKCNIGQYDSKLDTKILPEGTRDNGMYKLACSVISNHPELSKSEVIKIMQENNTKQCKPPLAENIIIDKVDGAWKFIKSQKNTDNNQNLKNQQKRMQIIKELMEENNFVRIRGDDKKRLYLEENRVYQEHGDDDLADLITDKWPDRSNEDRNYIITYIKDKCYASIQDFDTDPDTRNLKNGYFSISQQKLVEKENYKSLNQFDIIYDPSVGEHEEFKELVKQILPNDWEDRLDIFAMKFCGSMINPVKAFFDVGIGNNGKSTIYKIESIMLGARNVASITPQELSKDVFASSELYKKLAMICHDISDEPIEDMGLFKRIVSRDIISAQKKHQDRFEFEPECIVQVSCNDLPKIVLKYADARRIHIQAYEQIFEDGDPDYWKTFVDTPEKRSKIFNIVVNRLPEILKRKGKLANPQSPEQVMAIWDNSLDSIKLFCGEQIQHSKEKNLIPKKELVAKYEEWCKNKPNPETGKPFTPESSETFSRFLTAEHFTYKKVSIGGKKEWCWTNIKYRADSVITALQ